MDLKKLTVFLTVADYGNFTKAGEDLGYTQSGITQMMKSLEQEVGFPLFIKRHHGVTLTNEGEALLPAIRNLLSASESLNQEISFMKGAKKGTIKIGSYISCAIHWLPEIIDKFQKEYPEILFDIIEGDERDLADWVENHKVDIGFTSYQPNQNYKFIPVYDDPMYAVIPKNHPFAEYEEIPIEWYESAPFVVSEYTYVNEVHRLLKRNNVHPDIKYTMSNDFSILSMVEHNLGISILPGMILRGREGNYEARPLKPRAYRRLGMAISSTDHLSPAMKIFIKYARDYLLD
ncbi:MAG: LysR family transcriptional regulator [Lachnospiraceae bacterium]